MNYQRLFDAASDCVARFRGSAFPLKNVANDVIKARNLNSTERKVFLDLVFRFSREINLMYDFMRRTMQYSGSMTVQQKDRLAIELFLVKSENLTKTAALVNMANEYEAFVAALGDDRYLLALGPHVSRVLLADYPESASMIAKGFYEKSPKYLAIDRRYVSVSRICEILDQAGLKYFKHPMLSSAIGLYERIDLSSFPKEFTEHVWFMDAGSQIVAELIKPKPSDKVLDMCAGEGGKAQYITMNDCHYTAMDIDQKRLNKAKKRLIGRNVLLICADGKTPPFQPESFDWILLDAPCSGFGTLRRNYDLVHRLSDDTIKKYVSLERQLLKSAAQLLKPGGKLIYATCSLLKIENEQQIEWILNENSQIKPLRLIDLVVDYPKISVDALTKNSLSLFPNIHNCDGFYMAALTK